jgi:hypothetical protein
MPEIKLQPYMVALSFADGGPLFLNAVIADNPITATAMATADCMRHTDTDKPLMGAVCGQLMPGFIAMAQKVLRGDAPAASVVSLVQTPEQKTDEPDGPPPAELGIAMGGACIKHPWNFTPPGEVCAVCVAESPVGQLSGHLPPLPDAANLLTCQLHGFHGRPDGCPRCADGPPMPHW